MLHNLLGKPALEGEEAHPRVDRRAFRVLLGAAAFLILAFGVAFEVASATFVDPVEVRVADEGPGIPPAHREAIFAEEERSLESSGMGLGLYLVQTLLDLYAGKVEIEENEPRGAVFRVSLRLSTCSSASAERTETA